MIERILCSRCGELVGAVDTETGEREWATGARSIEDDILCRDCYNSEVLGEIPTMGGIDEDFGIIEDS